jgi:hypothetical protein
MSPSCGAMLVAQRSLQDGEASPASGIGLTPGAFDMAGLVRGSTERVATIGEGEATPGDT